MAVKQADAKAKPIEVLRIMTITSDEGPGQTPEKAFPFRTASHKNQREESGGCCQVNFSRSEKPEAGCAITLPPPHSAIRSPLRLERSAALIARRDGVEG
jgi:hypothetical protein